MALDNVEKRLQRVVGVSRLVSDGDLPRLFAQIGIGVDDGIVQEARDVARALVLGGKRPSSALEMALSSVLRLGMEAALTRAAQTGIILAGEQLAAWDDQRLPIDDGLVTTIVNESLRRIDARYYEMISQVELHEALGSASAEQADEGDGFVGIIPLAVVLNQAGTEIVWALGEAWALSVGVRAGYKKVAIAVVDNRTTSCCLAVHGQVRGINEPFHLTHPPAWASYMSRPPFHWYCRTVVGVVPDWVSVGVIEAALDVERARELAGDATGGTR